MESSPFYCNTWLMVLAVVLVNAAAWLLFWVARKIAPGIPKGAHTEFYLVTMPLGFLAVWSWKDPTVWFVYGSAVVGLLLIARCWSRPSREHAAE